MSAMSATLPVKSFQATAQEAIDFTNQNYDQLEQESRVIFDKKEEWKTKVVVMISANANPAESVTSEFQTELQAYAVAVKTEKAAQEVLDRLVSSIATCTREPISDETYATLEGLGSDIAKIKNAERGNTENLEKLEALKSKMDLLNGKIKTNVLRARVRFEDYVCCVKTGKSQSAATMKWSEYWSQFPYTDAALKDLGEKLAAMPSAASASAAAAAAAAAPAAHNH